MGVTPSLILLRTTTATDNITVMKLIMNCITVSVPQCTTQYRSQCSPVTKQECETVYRDQCNTQYEQKCTTQYKEEVEYYTETECNTDYKEDCEYQWEGAGNNKVWAPIPGSCRNNAYDNCGDVQKQKFKQVPYDDCQSVPKKVRELTSSHPWSRQPPSLLTP